MRKPLQPEIREFIEMMFFPADTVEKGMNPERRQPTR